MFEKWRVIISCLLILTSNPTLVTLTVPSCSTSGDCPKSYYCEESTCKKCLSCSLLFRKGNSCITNFIECGDCLPGYEEISITINSVIKKPCNLVEKNVAVPECSESSNSKSCPPNNYCNEGSCFKCFDCNIVNRLPPSDNCAKGLTECGSCRIGYQEVSVTTPLNLKPCYRESVKVSKSASLHTVEEAIVFGVISIFLVVILFLYSKKDCKGRSSSKSSLCAISPSAPPQHVMFEDDEEGEKPFKNGEFRREEEREKPLKNGEIKREEEREIVYPNLFYVNEQMQHARVFQQPNSEYYTKEQPDESSTGNELSERDIRRLSHQFGINIRGSPFSQQVGETVSESIRSSTVVDGISNNDNPDVELVQHDLNDVRIRMPTPEQPSEIIFEQGDRDDAESAVSCRCCADDADAVSKLN